MTTNVARHLSSDAISAVELDAVLADHVGRQRWYGGAPDDEVSVLDAQMLQRPWPGLLRVVFESPKHERYQTFLGLLEPGSSVDGPVGVLHVPEGDAVCVDALVDPELALTLLRHITPDEEATTARPIGTEQSNTSIVYDERLILKVFRRLVGMNPEVEMIRGLAGAGFAHVAPPVAVWQDGGDDLALLQPFLVGGLEGWALALSSLRVLLTDGGDPAASGADFAPEARRLGEVTADMHLALADAFGVAAGDAAEWLEAIAARVRSVAAAGVDADAVEARLRAAARPGDAGGSIRVHGDYHLGQVMRTDEGWFVLDFEGEPTRPIEERRHPSSPLRDVAGMLRSLSYAAAVAVRERGTDDGGDLADQWEERNREAFIAAYLGGMAGSPLLPADPTVTLALLGAFELDKAVYEVAYEAAHRPDWVEIPLAAVRRLVAQP